jgi:hypothetical protein
MSEKAFKDGSKTRTTQDTAENYIMESLLGMFHLLLVDYTKKFERSLVCIKH